MMDPDNLKIICCRQFGRSFQRQSGFSLLELMVGLALATMVLTAIISVFTTLTRSYTTQNVAADVQQTTRVGIDYIAQEVRIAGLNPLGRADASIEEIAPAGHKLRFSADRCNQINFCESPVPDGDLDDNSERVTYFYDQPGSRIRRCLGEPAATVLENDVAAGTFCRTIIDGVVPNPNGMPLFAFFDDDDPPNMIMNNLDRDQIRTIVITLTVEEPVGRGVPVSRTYSTRIRCRNLGL